MTQQSAPPTQTVVQNSKTEPWSEQIPYLKQVFGDAQKLYENNPINYFPGATVAPFSPETNTAFDAQTIRAMTGDPATDLAQGQQAYTQMGGYLDAGNPYFSGMADKVAADVLPRITSRFAAGNRLNSGLAARAASEGMTDALGGLAYQNYGDERNRMMQSAALAPQLAQTDYQDIDKLANVGAQKEDLLQQQINAQKAEFDFNQMEPWQRLGNYLQLVQGNYGGTTSGTQTSSYTPRASNTGSDIMGGLSFGLGTALQFAPLLMSDARVKADIRRAGKENGFNLYSFRYLWSPKRWIGVIAQEVQKVRPDAVHSVNGVLAVDYPALGLDMVPDGVR